MSTRLRLQLLTEIPAPYRLPIFNELAGRSGIDLQVSFLAPDDPRRPYAFHAEEARFPHRFLGRIELRPGGRWLLVSRGVAATILRRRPDVVIVGGWNQPAFWQALAVCRLLRTPVVAWVESTARDFRPGSGPFEALKQGFIRRCTAFLVPGEASADYLALLGVARSRIAVAPNAVDGEIFGTQVARARAGRDALRAQLGLQRPTALYVGRLDPEKGLEVLLQAAAGLDADIVIVGTGTLDTQLRAAAPANVRFVGWVDRDGLVPWYAAVDAFVLPSLSEQWGLVLNEAAEAGLPIVASDAAGATHALVEEGGNGFRVPAGDAGALQAALAALLDDPGLRERFGRQSLEIARSFTPAAWADAVVTLARSLVPAGTEAGRT